MQSKTKTDDMAKSNGRNGPKSIKAMTRGIGIGMSMLQPTSQPAQTTAIPQTPAVCTAAVKWKNTIHSPNAGRKRASDTEAILEKDENATVAEEQSSEGLNKSKKWPTVSNSKSKKPQAPATSKPTGKTKDIRNGKIKTGPKNVKPKKDSPSTTVPKAVDGKEDTSPKAGTTDSTNTPPTSADTNSTARASLVEVGEEETDPESSPDHQPRQQQVAIKGPKDDEEKEEDKNTVTRAENQLITAIPCMPLSLAGLCLFLNIFLPGTGTIIASFSVLCCSRKKENEGNGKKEDSVDIMITNFCVGVSQLFTITFFFIGLIWSITWGVFMVQSAWIQYKKDKEEKERLAAISVANAFMIPGMRS